MIAEIVVGVLTALIAYAVFVAPGEIKRAARRGWCRDRHSLLTTAREVVLLDRIRTRRWVDAVEGLIRAVNRSEPPEVKP